MYRSEPQQPSNLDFFRLPRETQIYANNAGDLAFALSCFGNLMPFLSDPVVDVLDGLRDRTAVDLGNGPVPLSVCSRVSDPVVFTTANLESGALSLMIEGVVKGLKGSGREHVDSHTTRALAGYIIGSEISENTDETYWRDAGRIYRHSISELAGIFNSVDTSRQSRSQDNTLEQALEDPSVASHYRFAGAAAKFVLACSLASMGALTGDLLRVVNRIEGRIAKTYQDISKRMLSASSAGEKYADNTESALTIAAMGDGYSSPAMINAMMLFVPTKII
jgi:hypothetical protein